MKGSEKIKGRQSSLDLQITGARMAMISTKLLNIRCTILISTRKCQKRIETRVRVVSNINLLQCFLKLLYHFQAVSASCTLSKTTPPLFPTCYPGYDIKAFPNALFFPFPPSVCLYQRAHTPHKSMGNDTRGWSWAVVPVVCFVQSPLDVLCVLRVCGW